MRHEPQESALVQPRTGLSKMHALDPVGCSGKASRDRYHLGGLATRNYSTAAQLGIRASGKMKYASAFSSLTSSRFHSENGQG